MIVVGVDGGIATMGIAVVDLAAGVPRLDQLVLIETSKDPALTSSEDATRRVRLIFDALDRTPRSERPIAIAAEAFSPPRSAAAAAKVAMAYAALVVFAHERWIPLHAYPPKTIKLAAGVTDSSKSAMRRAMARRWGERALRAALHDVTPSKQEHPIDALAAVSAWLDDPNRPPINR